ncbi:TetR family transcriptional regulator [Ornithinibacillus sp. L9]|uniref:TetR family transcriptional regulator n=1 Tax=Ornithinibacillus caprae TaxID=2678566 RepID=A0A6N8FPL8_9BACI|nr:TetR/AcrR family transcriptional regulator [Ornithinibacillus caprae]MUK89809.1 TetR family transcriptional regulator [Ornithinibacillus caprae]
MPKIVDHEKRKIKIAEATWKVIVEDGLEHATVRKIANASGMSVGSLRHYFPSQSELLLFSMELVSERVKQRAIHKKYEGPPLEMLMDALCELLPIDEDRTIEMEVWFVFSAKTLVDSKLEALNEKVYLEMNKGIGNVVQMLQTLKLAKDDLNPSIEIDRLHALIDGLSLHHLLHPKTFTKDRMIHTLKYHLQSLCK